MTKLSNIREMKARITVFGVGGAGGNAVNNMIAAGLQGVDFVVANTDAQALMMSNAGSIIHMGAKVTKGLGAGSQPEVGRAAAEESIDAIREHLTGSHMVFVTAGMGGGTGTGAAPIIANAARELGILTIGVVTKPFQFEGQRRMRLAEAGIAELLKTVDTALIIPNQNLFRVATEKTTFADAFALADQVLYSGVACISDLIVKEGLINLDFADVLTVMREKGKAMMGRGEASGEKRVLTAAVAAMSNPLIEDPSIKRASGLIISITGGKDMMLYEVDEAVSRIRDEADANANIIVGASFDDSLEGIVRVSVVATGIDNLDAARAAQMGETLTALAGRLNDGAFRASEPGANELADDRFGYAPQAVQRTPQAAQRAPLPPRAPLPQVPSPSLRPVARASEGRMARPIAENARHVMPQGFATPQGPEAYRPDPRRQASLPHAVEDDVLDIPAFLRRKAT